MSITSPTLRSVQPLALSTSRVGSSFLIRSTTRGVSNWPQPSLNGTHITMEGWLRNALMMLVSSVSILLRGFRGPPDVGVVAADVPVAAGHVLPDQQAELVAPVVPAVRLDLDVLAGHVHAELLGHLDVVLEGLVRRGGVQPIRPPALIERADTGTAACCSGTAAECPSHPCPARSSACRSSSGPRQRACHPASSVTRRS